MQPRMCVMLLAALAVSAQERQVGQGVNFYSRDKEASLGAQLAQEVRQRTTPLHTTTVRDFVERTGHRLNAISPDVTLTYTFSLIADEIGGHTHEPLSFPGGYIFVSASLILAAQNEAEFAGML